MLPKPSRWSQEGTYVQMLFGGVDLLVLGVHRYGCFNDIREFTLQQIAAMPVDRYTGISIQDRVEEDFGKLMVVLDELCDVVKELKHVTITFSGRPGDQLICRPSGTPLRTDEPGQLRLYA